MLFGLISDLVFFQFGLSFMLNCYFILFSDLSTKTKGTSQRLCLIGVRKQFLVRTEKKIMIWVQPDNFTISTCVMESYIFQLLLLEWAPRDVRILQFHNLNRMFYAVHHRRSHTVCCATGLKVVCSGNKFCFQVVLLE